MSLTLKIKKIFIVKYLKIDNTKIVKTLIFCNIQCITRGHGNMLKVYY